MAETKIEWCDYTFNAWRGCVKVSPACANCYAEAGSKRNPGTLGEWGPNGTRVVAAEAYWKLPEKWAAEARAAKERRSVFCLSLGDVFEQWDGPMQTPAGVQLWKRDSGAWETSDHYRDTVALTMDDVRQRLLRLARKTSEGRYGLDWLFLTKRPEAIMPTMRRIRYDVNTWGEIMDRPQAIQGFHFGVSVESADYLWRIEELRKVPSHMRFVSMEPLLGAVDMQPVLFRRMALDEIPGSVLNEGATEGWAPIGGIDWIIVGGESCTTSPKRARPMHPDWARQVRDVCVEAHVPFLFKQWGEWVPCDQSEATTEDALYTEAGRALRWPWHTYPDGQITYLVGKKLAGRQLDGRTWDEFPEVRHA